MLFETILFLIAISIGVFMIGIPTYKLFKLLYPPKKDSLAEAKQRLEQAKLDAETVRLQKETEQVYDTLYSSELDESSLDDNKHRRV